MWSALTTAWLHLLPAEWFSYRFWTSVPATNTLSPLSVLLLCVTMSRLIQHQSLCVCVRVWWGWRVLASSLLLELWVWSARGEGVIMGPVEGKPGHQGGIRTVSLLSFEDVTLSSGKWIAIFTTLYNWKASGIPFWAFFFFLKDTERWGSTNMALHVKQFHITILQNIRDTS